MQAIYHLSDAVNRADAIEQIYDLAVDALVQVLHVDRASILRFDADAVLRFKAWRNLVMKGEGLMWPQPMPAALGSLAYANGYSSSATTW